MFKRIYVQAINDSTYINDLLDHIPEKEDLFNFKYVPINNESLARLNFFNSIWERSGVLEIYDTAFQKFDNSNDFLSFILDYKQVHAKQLIDSPIKFLFKRDFGDSKDKAELDMPALINQLETGKGTSEYMHEVQKKLNDLNDKYKVRKEGLIYVLEPR
ncbi:MAG: hypothetical protein ACMXX6_01610 [Candidatus Woesearchaeota archaeon]